MGSSSLIDLLGAYSSLDFPGIPRDGSQDAGPGINNALKHIAARGIPNGTLFLAPGTYQIRTSVNLLSNIEICGAGPATVLQLGSGANVDVLIANQVSNWKLRNLRVDGNRANNTSGTRHNIWLYKVSDACLDNVESISARYDGFRLDDCERVVFLSPRASDNGRHGISVSYSRYNQIITPRTYDNCKIVTTGTGDGINFELLSGDNTVVCPMSYETAEAGDNQGYGIREAAGEGCYRNIVLGGALRGNKTGAATLESSDSGALTQDFTRIYNPTILGNITGPLVIGTTSVPGKITITGAVDDTTNDLAIQAHQPVASTFVGNTKDQLGGYFLIYGVADDFNTSQIVCGVNGSANIRFTFTSSKPGAVVGGEFSGNIAGGETNGDFTGSVWGAFGHCDFSGTGNSITITDAFGVRGDIGHSSSGSGYTITNAIAVYGVNPSAVNIGTITNAYSFFGDGRLGIGGTPASPKAVINADGTGSFGDAGVAGQALRIGATVNEATSYGLTASPALGASVTALSNIHSYPVVAARTPTNVYGFYAASSYRSTGSVTNQYGMKIENMGASWVTNAYGLYVNAQADAVTLNYAIYSAGGLNYFAGDVEMDGALNHDGASVGFYGTSPIPQAILATGAGASVDNVITALQNLGLVKQA